MLKTVEQAVQTVKDTKVWTYKDKLYRIQTVTIGMLSQDVNGEWVPTVIYGTHNATHDTQVVGTQPLNFCRPVTEFVAKFKPVDA
jgi:hypothetical protein